MQRPQPIRRAFFFFLMPAHHCLSALSKTLGATGVRRPPPGFICIDLAGRMVMHSAAFFFPLPATPSCSSSLLQSTLFSRCLRSQRFQDGIVNSQRRNGVSRLCSSVPGASPTTEGRKYPSTRLSLRHPHLRNLTRLLTHAVTRRPNRNLWPSVESNDPLPSFSP